MDYKEDVLIAHEIIDNIEREVKQKFKIELVAHFDPVVTDDAELNLIKQDVEIVLKGIDERLSFHDLRMVRGKAVANVIFDLVLPLDISNKELEIQQAIEEKLSGGEIIYHVIMNVDSLAFNDIHAKKGIE